MADYVLSAPSFVVRNTGNSIGFNYLGWISGYRGLIVRQKLVLNTRCKVGSISYGGYFQGAANKTFRCRINTSDSVYESGGTAGTVTLTGSNSTVGTVKCSFDKELEAGTYYIWTYYTDGNYGAVGNLANPFVYKSEVIESMVPRVTMKVNGAAKKAKKIWMRVNGQAKVVKALNIRVNGSAKKS